MKSPVEEDAVSPVIGVMLMIVVTIIIAAVVSAFAGGMSATEDKVPTAAFTVSADLDGNGTIIFKDTGGDELILDEVLVQMEYNDSTITLSNLDKMGKRDYKYLTELGNDADGFIAGGDRMVLTCDTNDETNKLLVFQPTDVETNFTIPYYAHVDYMIIDKESSKAIQTGKFILR
ncbi:FlaG/FlaF family flagellin (archaellin) [Methanomicrobium sp. W14]|uniref:type IV pilin N-terminal domain-containing protein n=1 Tax=Methanomicrobium sp. W14 TaxID=2817839 RepID=UPI001AE61638|nr:type IV pilin N-terminal domain-containing protein [Methanomicrobium sp. W14]MBP2133473.1 FlaG/FlaF family flagellin (archaellin) [Methanomicrobium sp. W14]